jgi:hypothetical protein
MERTQQNATTNGARLARDGVDSEHQTIRRHTNTDHERECYRPTLIFPDFSLLFLTF